MSRLIYFVTHGQKETGQPNPGLTVLGQKQIASLRPYLPQNPHHICCGMGKRHRQTAQALGLWSFVMRFSSIFGVPESKNRETDTLLLADGTEIPYEKYTFVRERREVFLNEIARLPSRTVIITSRPMIKLLNFAGPPKEAAVYSYNADSGEVKEVFAASSDIGAGEKEI